MEQSEATTMEPIFEGGLAETKASAARLDAVGIEHRIEPAHGNEPGS